MKINKHQKIVLTIYLAFFIIMLAHFVPFNIMYNYSADNSAIMHKEIIRTEYHYITYNYFKNYDDIGAYKNSLLDGRRLLIQILSLTIICGIPYLLFVDKN